MKSLLRIIAAVLLAVFAIAVAAANLKTLTIPILIFIAGCIALALALAIPAEFKDALATCAPYLPASFGRRAGDVKPPDPGVKP